MPLSSETLPDDDREARAAQSQQEQGQVSFLATAAWSCLLAVVLHLLVFSSFVFSSCIILRAKEADQRSRSNTRCATKRSIKGVQHAWWVTAGTHMIINAASALMS